MQVNYAICQVSSISKYQIISLFDKEKEILRAGIPDYEFIDSLINYIITYKIKNIVFKGAIDYTSKFKEEILNELLKYNIKDVTIVQTYKKEESI